MSSKLSQKPPKSSDENQNNNSNVLKLKIDPNNENKKDEDANKNNKRENKRDIFFKMLAHNKVQLPITHIGSNLTNNLIKYIKNQVEGKCNKNGFIKPDSVKLIKYSSGLVKCDNVIFDVIYECSVCNPVEGMIIEDAVVKDITKAGIRAEISDYAKTPLVIFITRDHHYNNNFFSTIKEKDTIKVRIIGQRFELNDEYISVIGELVNKVSKKNKLVINK
jgi:DNA-directed RNA polymerase subunit E'/Rpb7